MILLLFRENADLRVSFSRWSNKAMSVEGMSLCRSYKPNLSPMNCRVTLLTLRLIGAGLSIAASLKLKYKMKMNANANMG
jgi:hypothetical protein